MNLELKWQFSATSRHTTIPMLFLVPSRHSSTVSSMTTFMKGSKPRRIPVTLRPPFNFNIIRLSMNLKKWRKSNIFRRRKSCVGDNITSKCENSHFPWKKSVLNSKCELTSSTLVDVLSTCLMLLVLVKKILWKWIKTFAKSVTLYELTCLQASLESFDERWAVVWHTMSVWNVTSAHEYIEMCECV